MTPKNVLPAPNRTTGRAVRGTVEERWDRIVVNQRGAVMDGDGGAVAARRTELLRELRRINARLVDMKVPVRLQPKEARLFSVDQLETAMVGARSHYVMVVYQMGGTA